MEQTELKPVLRYEILAPQAMASLTALKHRPLMNHTYIKIYLIFSVFCKRLVENLSFYFLLN